jgi:hypothetical protein
MLSLSTFIRIIAIDRIVLFIVPLFLSPSSLCEGEVQEMIDLYKSKGFTEEEASDLMHIMAKNKDVFIDHMMVQVCLYGRMSVSKSLCL